MIKYAVRTGTPFTASALQILTGLGCRAYAATPSQCPRQATEAAQSDILITVHEKKDPKDTDGLAEIIWRENPEGQVKAYVVLNAKSGGDLIEALKKANSKILARYGSGTADKAFQGYDFRGLGA